MLGKKVAIVEAQNILAPIDPWGMIQYGDGKGRFAPGRGVHVHDSTDAQIQKWKVEEHVNTTCKEITETGVVCECEGKEVVIDADTVIVSLGTKGFTDQAYALGAALNVPYKVIGDCYHVGKVKDATSAGFFAAMQI